MKIGNYDGLTGEQSERNATPQEKAILEAEAAQSILDKETQKNVAENLWNTKVAAYQKLGLTSEEIQSIAPQPESLKVKTGL